MSFFNEKLAQAALVDSLFFITIVASLGTGLFFFAINYGINSEKLLNSFYSSDFTIDALKVISYVNITRDGKLMTSSNFVKKDDELDYLFAMIKEDYAEHNKEPIKITLDTQRYIARTLYTVLKPFDSSFDYVFFITNEGAIPGEQKFVVLIMALHKLVDEDDYSQGIERKYYFCQPIMPNVIENYIYPVSGPIDTALGSISFCETMDTCSRFVLGINIWVSKNATVFSTIMNGTNNDFKCEEIKDVIEESGYN